MERIINRRAFNRKKGEGWNEFILFRVLVVAVRRFPLRYASRALQGSTVETVFSFSYWEITISDYTFRKNYNQKKFEEQKLLAIRKFILHYFSRISIGSYFFRLLKFYRFIYLCNIFL